MFAVALLAISCTKQNKITILGENSSNLQAMQSLKSDYEADHAVKLDFKPNTMEDAFNKANQDFTNKTGLYDVVLQYNFSLSSYVRNNYVYKLSELKTQAAGADTSFEKDIFENVWKDVGYYYVDPQYPNDKKTEKIAYPFAANTMLLVYNKQLFNDPEQQKAYKAKFGEDLKVPTDLASFKRVAAFFTQPDKDLHGVCLLGSTGGWLYYEWCSFLQGFGGKLFDKDQGWKGNASTPVLLTSPQAVETTNYYTSLKPFNAGNYTTTDGIEQRNILKKGKVAMGIIWSDYMWGLINDGKGKTDDRFGFAPTPGTKSCIAGGSFYINKQSQNPKAAFEYVSWLLQTKNQIKLVKQGLCSPMKSVYNDPEVRKIPYIPALQTSLARAEYMLEAGPDADLINNVMTKYLQKVWNGELTTNDGLSKAKTEIEQGRVALFK